MGGFTPTVRIFECTHGPYVIRETCSPFVRTMTDLVPVVNITFNDLYYTILHLAHHDAGTSKYCVLFIFTTRSRISGPADTYLAGRFTRVFEPRA